MRKSRKKEEGVFFHIVCRCNNKECFFKNDKEKKIVLKNLARMKKKFSVVIQNFCIMDNHIHLTLILGKGEDISNVMRWFNSVTAVMINISLERTGHMWGDRFWSRIIRTLTSFLHTFRYINLNPVAAGLVKEAEKWEFGGLCHYKKYQGSNLLEGNPDWILSLFTMPWAVS